MKLFSLLLSFLLFSCQSQNPKKILTSFSGNAMTIDYRILIGQDLNLDEQSIVKEIIQKSFLDVDRIHNKWNPNSELSNLNRLNAFQKAVISQELFDLLHLSDLIYSLTSGRFDPTVEPLQSLWKAELAKNKKPSDEMVDVLKPSIGWEKIHFSHNLFWKEHDLTELDLSGVAKGYLVDLILKRLNEAQFSNAYVEWGGEIKVSGKHPEGRPWNVFISRLGDRNPCNAIDFVSLDQEALATSGDYEQSYRYQTPDGIQIEYFHLLNPKTGELLEKSENRVSSVTVQASSCALADGLATALLLTNSKQEAHDLGFRLSLLIPNFQFWVM